jgi:quinol monooxygenase YgiN
MMKSISFSAALLALSLVASISSKAQDPNRMYRIAKIKVDAKQLEQYTAALKEQMTTAIKLEPGVLSYTAVADKKDSTSITILEVYADITAYQSHIQTAHFKKYKETVKDMVQSLELMDTNLVCSAKKDDF